MPYGCAAFHPTGVGEQKEFAVFVLTHLLNNGNEKMDNSNLYF
jgi:hypothetical protein